MTTQTADVIIIGGGVQGVSLAFHLAARGVRPLVLEQRFLGAGATGRSSGLVRMHYDTEVESRLAWVSFGYFRDWAERVGGSCGFVRTGFVQIVARAHADHLRANIAMQQAIGIPTLLITAEDVRRLAPAFATDDFDLAAYEPESGHADPVATANSLMQAARQHGARVVQDCRVTAVRTAGGRVIGVESTQGTFAAPIVVNAAGAWAGAVNHMAGVELPLTVWKHDTMYIRRPRALALPHPTVIDFPNLLYFRPETGGLTLVGLEDANPTDGDPDAEHPRVSADFVERAVARVCRRVPALDEGGLHSAHTGFDGLTEDQRPLLGRAGPDGFYLNCGFSGTGFKTAPAVGLCMAELIVDGRFETIDLSLLDPGRVARGERVVGRHSYGAIWQ